MLNAKEKLYVELESLPDELVEDVLNYVQFIKLKYSDPKKFDVIYTKDNYNKDDNTTNNNNQIKMYSLEELFGDDN